MQLRFVVHSEFDSGESLHLLEQRTSVLKKIDALKSSEEQRRGEIAREEFEPIKVLVNKLKSEMQVLEKMLKDSGAPYTPGRPKAIN